MAPSAFGLKRVLRLLVVWREARAAFEAKKKRDAREKVKRKRGQREIAARRIPATSRLAHARTPSYFLVIPWIRAAENEEGFDKVGFV